MKLLDVGCGPCPRGDVNVDLYVEKTIHRTHQQEINPKQIRNFVKADSLHLPFKTDSFDNVVSYHVIEHVDNPTLFLKECIRVAKKQVLIVCPHAWARSKPFRCQDMAHKSYFRCKWFTQSLKQFYVEAKHINKPLFGIPFLPSWFSEIQVTIHIKKEED
jgi:ubiquinone/menaquinone biosynthesis C-methylase UbiE